MYCVDCKCKSICKIYDLKSLSDVSLQINNCIHKRVDNEVIQQTICESKENKKTVYTGKVRPDLKAIERQLNPEPEKPEPIKVQCPSCEGTTYDDDINFCSKCGKAICSNCGIASEGKNLCDECWKAGGI